VRRASEKNKGKRYSYAFNALSHTRVRTLRSLFMYNVECNRVIPFEKENNSRTVCRTHDNDAWLCNARFLFSIFKPIICRHITRHVTRVELLHRGNRTFTVTGQ
jgi:hypothetical protein